MSIADLTVGSAEDAARLAEPALESAFTAKQRFAVFVHDVIAHPLMWLTRDAKCVWRLHDWAGRVVLGVDGLTEAITVSGPGSLGVADLLRAHGHDIVKVWPSPDEVHSPYQSSGLGMMPAAGSTSSTSSSSSEPTEFPALAKLVGKYMADALAADPSRTETSNLVVGDQVAWKGEWLRLETVESDGDGWKLDLGGIAVTCGPSASWRVKVE